MIKVLYYVLICLGDWYTSGVSYTRLKNKIKKCLYDRLHGSLYFYRFCGYGTVPSLLMDMSTTLRRRQDKRKD